MKNNMTDYEIFEDLLEINDYGKYPVDNSYVIHINDNKELFIMDYEDGDLNHTGFVCLRSPSDIFFQNSIYTYQPKILFDYGIGYMKGEITNVDVLFKGDIKDIKQFFRKEKIERILLD